MKRKGKLSQRRRMTALSYLATLFDATCLPYPFVIFKCFGISYCYCFWKLVWRGYRWQLKPIYESSQNESMEPSDISSSGQHVFSGSPRNKLIMIIPHRLSLVDTKTCITLQVFLVLNFVLSPIGILTQRGFCPHLFAIWTKKASSSGPVIVFIDVALMDTIQAIPVKNGCWYN